MLRDLRNLIRLCINFVDTTGMSSTTPIALLHVDAYFCFLPPRPCAFNLLSKQQQSRGLQMPGKQTTPFNLGRIYLNQCWRTTSLLSILWMIPIRRAYVCSLIYVHLLPKSLEFPPSDNASCSPRSKWVSNPWPDRIHQVNKGQSSNLSPILIISVFFPQNSV